MKTSRLSFRRKRQGGNALIEFALVAIAFILLLLSFVEFGRMLLVYNSVANAARAGVRYAIVNGNANGTRAGSGPAANPTDVVNVVMSFARSAPLDVTRLSPSCTAGGDGRICVQYPYNSNSIGSPVRVTVVYRYDPLISILPLGVNLASKSEGVIVF